MLKKDMEIDGAFRKTVIKETFAPPKNDKKAKIRFGVQENIGDAEDHIADNAKMNSLLFSAVSALWDVLPEEQKNLIPEEKRGFIDYARQRFGNTVTLADLKFRENGIKEIDKLLGRQEKVGEIFMEEMKL